MSLLKKIEEEAVQEKILNLIPDSIAQEIVYYTQNEFSNRYKQENVAVFSQAKGESFLQEIESQSVEKPIFGEFLKYCDHLSAFLEAKISIEHGIKSKELIEGARNLEYRYNGEKLRKIDLGYLFREFHTT